MTTGSETGFESVSPHEPDEGGISKKPASSREQTANAVLPVFGMIVVLKVVNAGLAISKPKPISDLPSGGL